MHMGVYIYIYREREREITSRPHRVPLLMGIPIAPRSAHVFLKSQSEQHRMVQDAKWPNYAQNSCISLFHAV